jgi:hypothetical protein
MVPDQPEQSQETLPSVGEGGDPGTAPLTDSEWEITHELHELPDDQALAAEAELISGTDNQGPPPDDELA